MNMEGGSSKHFDVCASLAMADFSSEFRRLLILKSGFLAEELRRVDEASSASGKSRGKRSLPALFAKSRRRLLDVWGNFPRNSSFFITYLKTFPALPVTFSCAALAAALSWVEGDAKGALCDDVVQSSYVESSSNAGLRTIIDLCIRRCAADVILHILQSGDAHQSIVVSQGGNSGIWERLKSTCVKECSPRVVADASNPLLSLYLKLRTDCMHQWGSVLGELPRKTWHALIDGLALKEGPIKEDRAAKLVFLSPYFPLLLASPRSLAVLLATHARLLEEGAKKEASRSSKRGGMRSPKNAFMYEDCRLAHLLALESMLQQLDFQTYLTRAESSTVGFDDESKASPNPKANLIPDSEVWRNAFETSIRRIFACAEKISRINVPLKPAALQLMATILCHSPSSFFEQNYASFFQKRVIRHVAETRKLRHTLSIVLSMLRGSHARPWRWAVAHPHDSKYTFLRRRFRARDSGALENLINTVSADIFERSKCVAFKGPLVGPDFIDVTAEDMRALDLCTRILVQIAAVDPDRVFRIILPSLLAVDDKAAPVRPKSSRKMFVGLRALRLLLSYRSRFEEAAWDDEESQKVPPSDLLIAVASEIIPKVYRALSGLVSSKSFGEADFSVVPTQCRRTVPEEIKSRVRHASQRSVLSSATFDIDVQRQGSGSPADFSSTVAGVSGAQAQVQESAVDDSTPAFAEIDASSGNLIASAWAERWRSLVQRSEIDLDIGSALPSGMNMRDRLKQQIAASQILVAQNSRKKGLREKGSDCLRLMRECMSCLPYLAMSSPESALSKGEYPAASLLWHCDWRVATSASHAMQTIVSCSGPAHVHRIEIVSLLRRSIVVSICEEAKSNDGSGTQKAVTVLEHLLLMLDVWFERVQSLDMEELKLMLRKDAEKLTKPFWALELESLALCLLAIPLPSIAACALRLAVATKRLLRRAASAFKVSGCTFLADVIESGSADCIKASIRATRLEHAFSLEDALSTGEWTQSFIGALDGCGEDVPSFGSAAAAASGVCSPLDFKTAKGLSFQLKCVHMMCTLASNANSRGHSNVEKAMIGQFQSKGRRRISRLSVHNSDTSLAKGHKSSKSVSVKRARGHVVGTKSMSAIDVKSVQAIDNGGVQDAEDGRFREFDTERAWRVCVALIVHRAVDCADLSPASSLCHSTLRHWFKFLPDIASGSFAPGEASSAETETPGSKKNLIFLLKTAYCLEAMHLAFLGMNPVSEGDAYPHMEMPQRSTSLSSRASKRTMGRSDTPLSDTVYPAAAPKDWPGSLDGTDGKRVFNLLECSARYVSGASLEAEMNMFHANPLKSPRGVLPDAIADDLGEWGRKSGVAASEIIAFSLHRNCVAAAFPLLHQWRDSQSSLKQNTAQSTVEKKAGSRWWGGGTPDSDRETKTEITAAEASMRTFLRVVRLLTQTPAFQQALLFEGWRAVLKGTRQCISSVDARALERLGFAGIVDFALIVKNVSACLRRSMLHFIGNLADGGEKDHFSSPSSFCDLADELWPRNERRKAWMLLQRLSGYSENPIPSDHASVKNKTAGTVGMMVFARKCATLAATRLLRLGPVSLGAVVSRPDTMLWSWLLKSTTILRPRGAAQLSNEPSMLSAYLCAHWRAGASGVCTGETLVPYIEQVYAKLATGGNVTLIADSSAEPGLGDLWREADPMLDAICRAAALWLSDDVGADTLPVSARLRGLETLAQPSVVVLALLVLATHPSAQMRRRWARLISAVVSKPYHGHQAASFLVHGRPGALTYARERTVQARSAIEASALLAHTCPFLTVHVVNEGLRRVAFLAPHRSLHECCVAVLVPWCSSAEAVPYSLERSSEDLVLGAVLDSFPSALLASEGSEQRESASSRVLLPMVWACCFAVRQKCRRNGRSPKLALLVPLWRALISGRTKASVAAHPNRSNMERVILFAAQKTMAESPEERDIAIELLDALLNMCFAANHACVLECVLPILNIFHFHISGARMQSKDESAFTALQIDDDTSRVWLGSLHEGAGTFEPHRSVYSDCRENRTLREGMWPRCKEMRAAILKGFSSCFFQNIRLGGSVLSVFFLSSLSTASSGPPSMAGPKHQCLASMLQALKSAMDCAGVSAGRDIEDVWRAFDHFLTRDDAVVITWDQDFSEDDVGDVCVVESNGIVAVEGFAMTTLFCKLLDSTFGMSAVEELCGNALGWALVAPSIRVRQTALFAYAACRRLAAPSWDEQSDASVRAGFEVVSLLRILSETLGQMKARNRLEIHARIQVIAGCISALLTLCDDASMHTELSRKAVPAYSLCLEVTAELTSKMLPLEVGVKEFKGIETARMVLRPRLIALCSRLLEISVEHLEGVRYPSHNAQIDLVSMGSDIIRCACLNCSAWVMACIEGTDVLRSRWKYGETRAPTASWWKELGRSSGTDSCPELRLALCASGTNATGISQNPENTACLDSRSLFICLPYIAALCSVCSAEAGASLDGKGAKAALEGAGRLVSSLSLSVFQDSDELQANLQVIYAAIDSCASGKGSMIEGGGLGEFWPLLSKLCASFARAVSPTVVETALGVLAKVLECSCNPSLSDSNAPTWVTWSWGETRGAVAAAALRLCAVLLDSADSSKPLSASGVAVVRRSVTLHSRSVSHPSMKGLPSVVPTVDFWGVKSCAREILRIGSRFSASGFAEASSALSDVSAPCAASDLANAIDEGVAQFEKLRFVVGVSSNSESALAMDASISDDKGRMRISSGPPTGILALLACEEWNARFEAFLQDSYVDREWYDFYVEVAAFKSTFSEADQKRNSSFVQGRRKQSSFMSIVKKKILRRGNSVVRTTSDLDANVSGDSALQISNASVIIRRFIALDSFDTLALDADTRSRIFEQFEENRKNGRVDYDIFDAAVNAAVEIMRKDLPNFLRSRHAQPDYPS